MIRNQTPHKTFLLREGAIEPFAFDFNRQANDRSTTVSSASITGSDGNITVSGSLTSGVWSGTVASGSVAGDYAFDLTGVMANGSNVIVTYLVRVFDRDGWS